MKVNELKGYKTDPIYQMAKSTFANNDTVVFDKSSYRGNNLKKFTEFLLQAGFRLVGKGSFAAVYEKPNYPWLFKLFNQDSAYEQYIRWAIKNQDNPHVPKIKGGIIKINDQTHAIRMEKLTPFLGHHRSLKLNQLSNLLYNHDNDTGLSNENIRWIRDNYPQIMMRGQTPVIIDPIYDQDHT